MKKNIYAPKGTIVGNTFEIFSACLKKTEPNSISIIISMTGARLLVRIPLVE